MKKINKFLTLGAISAFALSSCTSGPSTYDAGDRMETATTARIDSLSYAMGVYFATTIKTADFGELNLNEINKGFVTRLTGEDKDLKVKEDQVMTMIQAYLGERAAYVAEKAIKEGEKFFEENKTKEGVIATESGLQYKILVQGEGPKPSISDTVEVNYKGSLLDGTEFDSSEAAGKPVKFALNQVIPGWTEGMQYLQEGGKMEIYIPSNLGYGANNYGPIPANSTLVFEVELVKVTPAAK